MATSTLVPLSEYLRTTYRPDCDWIDGVVKERNVGEGQHAVVQGFLIGFLLQYRKQWGLRVLPEQRVQTSDRHYRIPDVCVTQVSAPFEPIIRTAPMLCIEVLSRDDRMSEMQERVADYLGMGVGIVWLVDPWRRKAFFADAAGLHEAIAELNVPGTEILVPVAQIFSELDELEGKNRD